VRVSPADRIRGRFTLPGDKSISHRLAILGALAHGVTRLSNFASSADCASTLACLGALGVPIEHAGSDVTIRGKGPEALVPPARDLDCGNSGSTLRMLAGMLAGRPFTTVLTGDASLRRRPVERVAVPLRAMGARLVSTHDRPPLRVEGGTLRGIEWELPVASAQVKTAVLLAGLQADGRTSVSEPAASRDHTERLLPLFGAPVEREGLTVSVRGGTPLRSVQIAVPGDVSSAAFLVVAALTHAGSEVRLDGVSLNPGRTAFLDVLRAMGADLEVEVVVSEPEPVGSIIARSSRLHGISVPAQSVPALIDEVPILAVAAAFGEGRFSVAGAAELRVKESDRIAALVDGLRAMGVATEERPDGLIVDGGPAPHGAALRSHGDHRIAMALAVAALGAQGASEIDDAECAAVSFPEFFDVIARAVA
jgi:3-phosphoshikimate 1-carboxyvinyltransferase